MLRSFLARELVAFAQAHPGIEIDVDASHGYSDLARREADVAVRMSDDVEGDLVARRVIRYRKAVYASSLHIGAATDGVLDPAVHNWIGWGDGLTYPSWPRETPVPDLPVRTRLFSNNLQIEAARA